MRGSRPSALFCALDAPPVMKLLRRSVGSPTMRDGLVQPRLSVVIPTYNRGSTLANTLRMALQQEYDDYELIVVDQSARCSREVEEIIEGTPDKIRYLRLEAPNLPAARNAGVRAAAGDVIVFIDDDVEIGPGYLRAHARHYHDPSIGGVTGLTLPPGAKADTGIVGSSMITGFVRLLEGGSAHVSWIPGCNGSYRKSAVVAAGMSDERFTGGAWSEDADLSVRVRHLGFALLFDPDIRLVHLASGVGGSENRLDSDAKLTEHLLLHAYFLIKNRRIIGTVPALSDLMKSYRSFALSRRTLRGGASVILRNHCIFVKCVRRAFLCVGDASLPVIE